MKLPARVSVISLFTAALAAPVHAMDPPTCSPVRFADVGWTDISVTTGMARLLLDALGYTTQIKRMSVPDTYAALGSQQLDVFLGNWMPSMEKDVRPYLDNGSVQNLGVNLEGAKYTLAVNRVAYEGGIRSFADLARFKRQLDGTLYGLEPGNDGNQLIQRMIAENAFGLGEFKLVESSESGMLGNVLRAERLGEWIVFLGWAPHPMNTRFDIHYLEGGDEYFGPDFGGATVYTNVRKGFVEECPNAGRLIGNLRFTLDMENRLMDEVLSGEKSRRQMTRDWLRAHPDVVARWLDGVQAKDGRPGIEAVRQALEL